MAPKNPWKKGNPKNNQRVAEPSCSSSDNLWRGNAEDFPALGAPSHESASFNVWEKRKAKLEAVKALQPQNEYDEEAMLQQALALSMLEASKEEKRKELEEEYRLQMEALQNAPELLDELSATDEFVFDEYTETKSDYCDYNNEKHEEEELMKYSSSDCRQREHVSSFKGAKPKINSAIDRFGGWGLKDTKIGKTETLSNFVDKVVYRESSKSEQEQNGKYGALSEFENKVKSKEKNVLEEDIWSHSQDVKAVQASKDKILYDGKGTFIDSEEGDNHSSDSFKEKNEAPNVSQNEVLDTWLSSDDADDCVNDTAVYEKHKSDTAINDDLSCVSVSDESESRKMKDNKSGFVDSRAYAFCDNEVSRNASNQSLGLIDSNKKLPSYLTDDKEQNGCPLVSSSQKFVQEQDDFSLFRQPKFPSLINEIWSENNALNSYASTNKSKLCNETDPVNYTSDPENKLFSSESPNSDFDLPPILPPNPSSVVPTEEAGISCKEIPPILPPKPSSMVPTNVVDSGCKDIPPILPPSAPVISVPQSQIINNPLLNSAPEISVPQSPIINNPLLNPGLEIPVHQSPIMNNPLLNPLAPGLNPMAGYYMDPLFRRQMLILHNPFLASQMFAMEQYYRSLGMPIDMFSATNPIPPVPMPGLMNNPLSQNMFTDSFNPNLLPDNLLQSQTHINSNPVESDSERNANIPGQKSIPEPSQISQFDITTGFSNTSSLFEKDSVSSWHQSFLLNNDELVIPPPKPPSDIPHLNAGAEVPKSNQSPDFANCVNSSSQVPYPNSCLLGQKKVNLEGNADSLLKVSKPKTEPIGWGDPDNDSFDIHQSKTSAWGDSWDDESVPTKPLRNLSLYEDKKITDLRQPSRQPRMNSHRRNYR